MNGEQLLDYALTVPPHYARLLHELRRYSIMPSLNGSDDGMIVYCWRAGVKSWQYIGRRANYAAADLFIRKTIRRRRACRARRYPCQRSRGLYIRCDYCGYLRRRTAAADDMCYDCYWNIWHDEPALDDYPALDADWLFR